MCRRRRRGGRRPSARPSRPRCGQVIRRSFQRCCETMPGSRIARCGTVCPPWFSLRSCWSPPTVGGTRSDRGRWPDCWSSFWPPGRTRTPRPLRCGRQRCRSSAAAMPSPGVRSGRGGRRRGGGPRAARWRRCCTPGRIRASPRSGGSCPSPRRPRRAIRRCASYSCATAPGPSPGSSSVREAPRRALCCATRWRSGGGSARDGVARATGTSDGARSKRPWRVTTPHCLGALPPPQAPQSRLILGRSRRHRRCT
mmetsp:Transcript_52542/g.151443  ORF Transcript_52542/g.151443 Transcript_52542/m.151443 type:complete len:254 (-) Transcript_52542:1633-2394(-)